MELTLLLAQVIGAYLVIVGLATLTRRRELRGLFAGFAERPLLIIVISIIELIVGLFLIFTHNLWTNVVEGIVSAFGWIMAAEGALYLFLPQRVVRRLFKVFNRPTWYVIGGLVSVVLGIYLAGSGFGWF